MRRTLTSIVLCLTMMGVFAPSTAEVLHDCATVQPASGLSRGALETSERSFPYFSIETPKGWREFSRGYFLRQASETDQTGIWVHASPEHQSIEIAEDLENIFDAAHVSDRDCVTAGPDAPWRVRFARSDDRAFAIAHADHKGVGYAVLLSGNDDDAVRALSPQILLPMLSSFEPATPDAANEDVATIFIVASCRKEQRSRRNAVDGRR